MNLKYDRAAALQAASLLGMTWLDARDTADVVRYEECATAIGIYQGAVAGMSGLSLRDTWIDELNSICCVGEDTWPGVGQE